MSNFTLPMLEAIYARVLVKPTTIQNRVCSDNVYDSFLREFCTKENIAYQSFGTLKANLHLLISEPVQILARNANISEAIALYYLIMNLNLVVVNGTTSADRMRQDVAGHAIVQDWKIPNPGIWARLMSNFGLLINIK